MILFVALFLMNSIFEANVLYTAQSMSCVDGGMQVEYEGNVYPVELFNVDLSADGYLRACSLIEKSSILTFEFDESVSFDTPLSLWLFIDGELLQEKLIQEGFAQIRIANPTYKYMDQCLKVTESTDVFAPEKIYKDANYTNKGTKVCLFLISATAIYAISWLGLTIRKRKREKLRLSEKTNQNETV